jgi:hypothetical protein
MQSYELYTEQQFNDAKVIDLLPIKCSNCETVFYKTKSLLYSPRRRKQLYMFCCDKCQFKYISIIKGTKNGNCKQCGAPIIICKSVQNRFCSSSCAATYNNTGKIRVPRKKCLNCSNMCYNLHTKFCTHKCSSEYRLNQNIEKWKAGKVSGHSGAGCTVRLFIRRYLFKKYDNKCCKCGWHEVNSVTKKIPLEINHIDGNAKNTIESNLELICPNCHSLTCNYKALNAGHGTRCKFKSIPR